MSLLIIHCPVKPFIGSSYDYGRMDVQERFAWILMDEPRSLLQQLNDGSLVLQDWLRLAPQGVSAIEAMPYADEVVALIPTVDVRIIETRVPLVAMKKLRQALPSLVEEYLLTSPDSMCIQLFPPQINRSATERTLALVERHWLDWLSSQLWELMSPSVRLVPDFFVLEIPDISDTDGSQFHGMYGLEQSETTIITLRTGLQTGVAWAENMLRDEGHLTLPKVSKAKTMMQFSWSWVAPKILHTYFSGAESLDASVNLLLAQTTASKKKKIAKKSHNQVSISGQGSNAWLNKDLWIGPFIWFKRCLLIMTLGGLLNLLGLALVSWQWASQIDALASSALASPGWLISQSTPSQNSVIDVLAAARMAQNERGLLDDADFLSLAGKLEQLKIHLHHGDCIERIRYDGKTLLFSLKKVANNDSKELIKDMDVTKVAADIGMYVEQIDMNEFQLFPYAGLLHKVEGVKSL